MPQYGVCGGSAIPFQVLQALSRLAKVPLIHSNLVMKGQIRHMKEHARITRCASVAQLQ